MNGFAFRKNTNFRWHGVEFRIDRITPNEEILLERIEDGTVSIEQKQKLLEEYVKGHITSQETREKNCGTTIGIFSRPLEDVPEPMRQEAARRRHYVKAVLSLGKPLFTNAYLTPLIEQAASEISDKKPPSVTTFYRWLSRLRANDDSRALLPRYDKRGSRHLKQNERVLGIVSHAMEIAFKASPQASMKSIYTRVLDAIKTENRRLLSSEQLQCPSLRTVYRMFSRLDAFDQVSFKEGKAAAEKKFRIVKSGVLAHHILERVEIDHTPLDLFLIDEKTRLPLGRPTLTIAIDHYSRMPVGYYISYGAPSSEAVIGVLRHGILPKREINGPLEEIKSQHKWPCYGRPDSIVVDNGLEFHANDLESIAFDLDIKIQYCPKHQPRFKGVVERFLKTFNYSFAHQLPGTSFARLHLRGDYNSENHAVLTFVEFQQIVEKWILDDYAQTVHRGIGTTPWAKWQEGLNRRQPELPSDIQLLQRRIGKVESRSLRKDGIHINGIRYNSDALSPILRTWGEGTEVRVVYDPEDLGAIQVWGPQDSDPVLVPALDQDYASGLTRRQNALVQQIIREDGASKSDKAALEKAREDIARTVDKLAVSRKQGKRRQSAAIRGISTNNPAGKPLRPEHPQKNSKSTTPSKPISPNLVTDLPPLLSSFTLKRSVGGQS